MVESKRPSLKLGIIISLVIHILLPLIPFSVDSTKINKANDKPIEVEIISSKEKENLIEKMDQKLIVDQNQINDEIDMNAKYLSAHNQKVIKETVARKHGEFQNIKNNKAAVNEKVKNSLSSPTFPPQKLVKSKFGLKKLLPERNLFSGYQAADRNTNKNPRERNGLESQSRDYLPNTEAGMETLLATREFVYYSYYNRIRNQLSQYWEPRIKEKFMALFKKGRRISNSSDKITKVLIVLDGNGTLIKVQIMSESGISDLDDVAVEAFRLAAPFPNPPKGIVDVDGTIKIRWDFIVES